MAMTRDVPPAPTPELAETPLSAAQRDSLVRELFALGRVLDPGPGTRCFSGSDQDLIEALQRARTRASRERDEERE